MVWRHIWKPHCRENFILQARISRDDILFNESRMKQMMSSGSERRLTADSQEDTCVVQVVGQV